MRLIFLGPPGAGKGTQARQLAREWSVPQIATGEMLREAVAAGTPLGREAKRIMDTGALVPDDVMVGRWNKRVPAHRSAWAHFKATFGDAARVDDKRRRHLQRFVLPVRWIEQAWRE